MNDNLRRLLVGLTTFVLVVLLGVVILRLPRTDDRPPPDLAVLEAAEDPQSPAADILTCERTLPDQPTVPEDVDPAEIAEQLQPLGRVTSSEIVECPDLFDGQAVVYVGEVVGDVLERDDGAWVLMNDDAYALEVGPLETHGQYQGTNSGLSVWLPDPFSEIADEPGRAGRRGEVLLVRGIVHRVDPDDGGGLSIRAFDAELLDDARVVEEPFNHAMALTAGILATLALMVVALERTAMRRR